MEELKNTASATKEAEAFIKENTASEQHGGLSLRPWGLILDYIEGTKHIPPKYIGADFYEMDHSEIIRFFRMSNEDKFLYAYWAQRYQSRRMGVSGFIFGFGISSILALVFVTFIFS